MNLLRNQAKRSAERAFTMVEIAIAIGVIGFALVAIVGVLPTGLQTQRDNREDTIVNHDGVYWLEAIRSGSAGSVELSNFVQTVTSEGQTYTNLSTAEILGKLTADVSPLPYATVRAITGPAVERDMETIGFSYNIYSQVKPSTRNTNVYDIRIVLRWPVSPNGSVGKGRKAFRTIVSGRIVQTNNAFLMEPNSFGPST